MSEWQPIETIPAAEIFSDQTRVLVWVADGGPDRRGGVAFGYAYIDHKGRSEPRAEGYMGDFKITRWMPLPLPPKGE